MADNTWLSLATGAAGGSLVFGLGYLRDYFKQHKDGQFAALYLCVALEEYASETLSRAHESITYQYQYDPHSDNNDHITGRPLGNALQIKYPADLDWKSLGVKTTASALTFKINVEGVRSNIEAAWEFDDDYETETYAREQAVELALEAWAFAMKHRHDWKLPRVKADDDGKTATDYLAALRDRMAGEREEREKRKRRYQEEAAASAG